LGRDNSNIPETEFIVICCGGGGIPVIRYGRTFSGVDAVIDKDLSSARLAEEVGADIFVIATDVEGVALRYGKPDQTYLRNINIKKAMEYLSEGHFPSGSMGPKIEAATEFLEKGGKRAVITSIKSIETAVKGLAGTEITRNNPS